MLESQRDFLIQNGRKIEHILSVGEFFSQQINILADLNFLPYYNGYDLLYEL